MQFLNSAEDVDQLNLLVKDIHGAMVDHQVCHQRFVSNPI